MAFALAVPAQRPDSASFGEPKLEHRGAAHYVAIRSQVAMNELGAVIPKSIGEVSAWLAKHAAKPVGPPFIRYLVIDMPKMLDVEIGFPVQPSVAGGGHVHAGVLPAGKYTTLVYTGVRNGVAANAALQEWAKKRGIKFDMRQTKRGSAWGGRAEFFLTGPAQSPDAAAWKTEIVYLVAPGAK